MYEGVWGCADFGAFCRRVLWSWRHAAHKWRSFDTARLWSCTGEQKAEVGMDSKREEGCTSWSLGGARQFQKRNDVAELPTAAPLLALAGRMNDYPGPLKWGPYLAFVLTAHAVCDDPLMWMPELLHKGPQKTMQKGLLNYKRKRLILTGSASRCTPVAVSESLDFLTTGWNTDQLQEVITSLNFGPMELAALCAQQLCPFGTVRHSFCKGQELPLMGI